MASTGTWPPRRLGAAAVSGALQRSGVPADAVNEVIMGCIGQVGPESYNARRVALGAGLPQRTTAFNVNRLCGSGLQAVFSAAQSLAFGTTEVVIAGGNESMTNMPYLDYSASHGRTLGHRKLLDGTLAMLTDPFSNKHMAPPPRMSPASTESRVKTRTSLRCGPSSWPPAGRLGRRLPRKSLTPPWWEVEPRTWMSIRAPG